MSQTFVPAAGLDFLLPFYDPLWRLMGGETMRAKFIRDASLAAGQRILDIGCGTGSLLVQIADTVSGTRLSGLDPDPKALARSRNKAARAGADVNWTEGFADQLPHADASFDRVISSFMFHHLGLDVKRGMLREARRVLVAGGELHLVDFGGEAQRAGRPARSNLLRARGPRRGPGRRSQCAVRRSGFRGRARRVAGKKPVRALHPRSGGGALRPPILLIPEADQG